MGRDLPQVSFGGGIVSESVFARVDLQKFGSAAKTLDNFFVHAEGGISNRAGTYFIKGVKDSTKRTRLIPFIFNTSQSYALEFGDQYMRVITSGGYVVEATQTITLISQTNPAVVDIAGHPYSNGDEIFITGVAGMTEVNDKFYIVANATANDFELQGIDATGYTAYSSGGTAARVFELATPYLTSELPLLKYRRSNDVMYITHRNHAPRKLNRIANDNWTLTTIAFRPSIDWPINGAATPAVAGSETYKYKVTAISASTGEESLTATETTQTITNISQTNPAVVDIAGHTYNDGDEIHIDDVVGMTEVNGLRFIVANATANDFELKGIDATGYTAYSSGGTAARTIIYANNAAAISSTNFITVTIDEEPDAEKYNVYRESNGLYGFIGSTETLSFKDTNFDPDLTDTAPKWRQPFSVAGDYPGVVGIHEERTAWGNTDNEPLLVELSQTGQFENMNVSSPSRATDSVSMRLVSGDGLEIRHFRSFQERLFVFTSGVLWSIRPGGDTDAIAPNSKKRYPEDLLACTDVPPIIIKSQMLMVAGTESTGFEVHAVGFKLESETYTGSDLTVLARDLFVDYTIEEWAYAERPYRLLACVRSDGKLLVMTYLQEHQVFAWSLWETDGEYESVCSIPEGNYDTLYVIARRDINGSSVRYVEYFDDRRFSSIESAHFVDSGLVLDNPTNITGATQTNPVVISTAAHSFTNGMSVRLRDIEGMTELNGNSYTVANATATTFELSGVDGTGYGAYVSGGTIREEVSSLSGLDHLEGETLVALADGNIDDGLLVTNGTVSLTNAASIIHIGKPYDALMTTLPLNAGPDTISKKKIVNSVSFRVKDTRGLFIGSTPDKSKMNEYPTRSTEDWDTPASTLSTIVTVPISNDWKREQGVSLRSDFGLPVTILSAIPNLEASNK